MKKDSWQKQDEQVKIVQSKQEMTQYAGTVGLKREWKRLQMDKLIRQAGVHYGQGQDKAADLMYALTLGPLVNANSVRKVAQRFGGEVSLQQQEADALLSRQVDKACSQRTLARFVNCPRHEWQPLQVRMVAALQKRSTTRMAGDGVIVIDDMPILKPYAKEMEFLGTIYDSNRKRYELGYPLVHLYYYHPHATSYSLSAALWRKSSLTGECKRKPTNAMRRAKAGEEKSKLDLALDMLEALLPAMPVKPTLLFDSWYCARWFVAQLTALGFAWISQASRQRKFETDAGYLDVPQLIDHYKEHLAPVPGFGKVVRAYALPALMLPDEYIRKSQPVQLVLVQGYFSEDKPGTIRLLVCNRLPWSLHRILVRYGYRSAIEFAHRTGKQLEGWGDFHSRRWPSLQAHCAISLVRSVLLTLLSISRQALRQLSIPQLLDLVIRQPADLDLTLPNRLRLILPGGQPALAAVCPKSMRFY